MLTQPRLAIYYPSLLRSLRWLAVRNGLSTAVRDIFLAFQDLSLIGMLGWLDVRHRYKRSRLGAFWLTISMGVMIGTMGIVFSKIFHSSIAQFLPFLSIGMILWGFITATVNDACAGFVSAHYIIKQLPLPLFSHIARIMWRNILIFGHNLVIFPLVLLCVHAPIHWIALITIPGFLLLTINLTWIALALAILCARYRDLIPIVSSVLQIVFYVTPIMWMPNTLSARAGAYLIDYNPLYHVLSIVREPLLGQLPTTMNWMVSLGLALAGWGLTLIIYGRCKNRIAYWL